MNNSPQITLAIESAISGGSLSLLADGVEIANWTGTSNVSKAEDLLFNIDALLTQNGINRREINLIAVSAGPGSFTGIRIGIATALGLKTGLGIGMVTVSLLKAMAITVNAASNIAAAVPVGRDAVCLLNFSNINGTLTEENDPISISENNLFHQITGQPDRLFLLNSTLCEKAVELPNIHDCGINLARLIGISGIADRARPNIKPIFISKSF